MRFFLSLLFSINALLASNIISHNIYERSDRVDIMLLFDSPFDGKITKKEDSSSTILILQNAIIDKKITEKINSKIVQNLSLTPYKNQTFVEIDSKNQFEVSASKTVDNFGLRLRIKPKNGIKDDNLLASKIASNKYTTKQDSSDITTAFIKVVSVLLLLVVILYFLKNWITNRANSTSWLFSNQSTKKQNIKILNQRALDTKNRIALIKFKEHSYLVILGSSNILLDKFKNDAIDEKEFENILHDNTQKLDQFFKSKVDKLNIYKNRASKDS